MKNNLNALLFAVAIIAAAVIVGNAIVNRNKSKESISVTGSASMDFTSDLIVWEGYFNKENRNLKEAYAQLELDKKWIEGYLASQGINSNDFVFSAVNTLRQTKANYSSTGEYMGEEFTGYNLSQNVQINSSDVEKVERISREITELLNKGVQLYSQPPRYYYTKLADLKIEMISKATEDARLRAEKIAANSGAQLGKLTNAKMGIFQITGQHSNEDYSWGGVYNTASKEKTASITMKLDYKIK